MSVPCSCLGTCKGAEGLAAGYVCALVPEAKPQPHAPGCATGQPCPPCVETSAPRPHMTRARLRRERARRNRAPDCPECKNQTLCVEAKDATPTARVFCSFCRWTHTLSKGTILRFAVNAALRRKNHGGTK